MKKPTLIRLCACFLVIGVIAATVCYLLWGQADTITVIAPARFSGQRLVIDAGHGGEDGGAVSASGISESTINLAIALRLDSVMGLYGVDTLMLRTTDISLHDSDADTLRKKKVSDLHNRVAAIESVDNATLISIHQTSFGDRKYHGAQVFYSNDELSLSFARYTQEMMRVALDPGNNRQAARIPTSVYLMNHITCRAILVECGFLSNYQEDALLQTSSYQTKIAAALAGAYLNYQNMPTPEGVYSNEG